VKRTPKPWKVKKRTTPGQFVTDTLIVSEDGSVLANLHCEAEGNSPLIAAAPELLEACDTAADVIGSMISGSPDQRKILLDVYNQLRKAVEKANGHT
jgi:hypothetical protein